MGTKKCTSCGLLQDTSEFHRDRNTKDGLAYWCKTCRKEYINSHGEGRLAAGKKCQNRFRARQYRKLYRYLKSHPCVDCGETEPLILEFDHVRGDKRITVSQMIARRRPWEEMLVEIAKCEVRCSNCHQRRHLRGTLKERVFKKEEELKDE